MINHLKEKTTVLLAEDDDDDVFLFKSAAAEFSKELQIIVAPNGIECMQLLHSHPLPDIIFLDINMPMKDGLQCLHEIRLDVTLRSLPVVVLSTASDKSVVEEAYSRGANRYIRKAVGYDEFKKTLASAFTELILKNNQLSKQTSGEPKQAKTSDKTFA